MRKSTNEKEPLDKGKAPGNTDEEEESTEDVYEVEAIVRHKVTKSGIKYFLKWFGYDEDSNEWISEDEVFCDELIIDYWKTKSSTQPPRNSRAYSLLHPDQTSSGKKRKIITASDSEDGEADAVVASTVNEKSKKRAATRDSATKAQLPAVQTPATARTGSAPLKSTSSSFNDQAPNAIEVDEHTAKMYGLSFEGSWDDEIDHIETMEQTSNGRINVYFFLKQKEFAVLPVDLAHRFFPKLMLEFYLSKLKFTRPE